MIVIIIKILIIKAIIKATVELVPGEAVNFLSLDAYKYRTDIYVRKT